MIIRATFIRRGRQIYTCYLCQKPIHYHHISVYGNATDLAAKPETARLHIDCAMKWHDPKIPPVVLQARAYEALPRKLMTAKQNGLYSDWG